MTGLRAGRPLRGPGRASPRIAEAMSGFASINGEPEGGPLLPPIALTDEITALVGAFATMTALWSGRRPGGRRQPARVAVPVHGPAGLAPTPSPATSSPGSARASPTRCRAARGGAPTATGWRCPRRRSRSPARVMALIGFGDRRRPPDVQRPHRRPRRDRRPHGRVVRRPHPRRGAGRVRGGRGRRRPRLRHGRHRRPTPTTPPAARSSTSAASPCRASSPASPPPRARSAGPAAPSARTTPRPGSPIRRSVRGMPVAEVRGARIAYDDTGGEGPPVILAHGFLMDRSMFDSAGRGAVGRPTG